MWELYGVEWEQAPAGLHWTILEMRAYAQAYEVVRHGTDEQKRQHPGVTRVYEVIAAIAEEKRAKSAASQDQRESG